MILQRSRIPVLILSVFFASAIQYAPVAWADDDQIVEIEGKTACWDGHKSARCGWNGIPDLSPNDDPGPDQDRRRVSDPTPTQPKRTAEQKAAAVAICKEQKAENAIFASNINQTNMGVCSGKNSSWYGYLHQEWLRTGLPFFGYAPTDCASVNSKAYFDVQAIIQKRYENCYDNAMKD